MLTFDEVREYNRAIEKELSNAQYFAEAFNKCYEKEEYKKNVIFVPWSYGYKDENRIIQNSLAFLAHFDQKLAPGANWSRDNILLWNYYLDKLNIPKETVVGWFGHCYSDKCNDLSIETMKATGERAWNDEVGLDSAKFASILKNHSLIGYFSCFNYPGTCTIKTYDSLNCGYCGNVCFPGDCVSGKCVGQ